MNFKLKLNFGHRSSTTLPQAGERIHLASKPVRIPCTGQPLRVEMGKQSLHLYPDTGITDSGGVPHTEFRIVDPDRYFHGISHFVRLPAGAKFKMDGEDEDQKLLFGYPKGAFRHDLRIEHQGEALVISARGLEADTYLSVLDERDEVMRLQQLGCDALRRVMDVYGGPLVPLPPGAALATLREVNERLRQSPFRPRDSAGDPGGLLELPPDITPIIVGDLHGRVDNLLKVLAENVFLESLESGRAFLILLGDAVHSDVAGELESMESSVLTMDLIFRLMLRFPERMCMLLGNHDSFSPDVMKCGIAQSLLWKKTLRELRGDEYCREMEAFYQLCPLVAVSEDFLACHAGPPRAKVSREMITNLRQSPELQHDLTWSRVKSPGFPGGYSRSDVKRFRKSMGLPKRTPFIVGHHVMSEGETLWRDVSGIAGCDVLYCGDPHKLATFTRVDGVLVAQFYRGEPLLEWTNQSLPGVCQPRKPWAEEPSLLSPGPSVGPSAMSSGGPTMDSRTITTDPAR